MYIVQCDAYNIVLCKVPSPLPAVNFGDRPCFIVGYNLEACLVNYKKDTVVASSVIVIFWRTDITSCSEKRNILWLTNSFKMWTVHIVGRISWNDFYIPFILLKLIMFTSLNVELYTECLYMYFSSTTGLVYIHGRHRVPADGSSGMKYERELI